MSFHGNRVACRDVAGLNPAKRRSRCSRVELRFLLVAEDAAQDTARDTALAWPEVLG